GCSTSRFTRRMKLLRKRLQLHHIGYAVFLFVISFGIEQTISASNSHSGEAAVTAQRLPICFANVGCCPTRQTCYMATPVWRSHMV
ncbi:MAG: hypothetical protein J6B09_05365, partial [Clostridia bacterium]|nr:hypothetical protein [Clostridia bacterium]